MDDTRLAPEEERQLREALAGAPQDLKDAFCSCWPAVKKLLEWLSGRLSGVFKWVVELLIWLGDGIFKVLDCKQKTSQG